MKRVKERFFPNHSTRRDRPDLDLNYYIRTCPHKPDKHPPQSLKGINAPIHFSDRVVAKWHRYSGHLLRLLESRSVLVPTLAGATVSTLLCFLLFGGTRRAQWTRFQNVENVEKINIDGKARPFHPHPLLSLQEHFHQLVSSIRLGISFPRSESEPEAEVTPGAGKIAGLARECWAACRKSWVAALGNRLSWDLASSSVVDGCQLSKVGSSQDAAWGENSLVLNSQLPHQMNSLLAAPELCV